MITLGLQGLCMGYLEFRRMETQVEYVLKHKRKLVSKDLRVYTTFRSRV